MSKFTVGEEVLFKGKRAKIMGSGPPGYSDLYIVETQPGSQLTCNVPSVMLSRPPVPSSPEDVPVARIEEGIAHINQQLKGIRELLSKRMPKQRTKR